MSKRLRSLPQETTISKKRVSLEEFFHNLSISQAALTTIRCTIKRTNQKCQSEEMVGLQQSTLLKQAVEMLYEQLRSLSSLLEDSERLPIAAEPYLYPILINLALQRKYAEGLLGLLVIFRSDYVISSTPNFPLQRAIVTQSQTLLEEGDNLDTLIQHLYHRSLFFKKELLAVH